MKKYNHIFFDLDRTLWDFNRNSEETINELLIQHKLIDRLSSEEFIAHFFEVNEVLWERFRKEEVSKEQLRFERFQIVFERCGLMDETLAKELGRQYVEICPNKTYLKEGTHQMLSALHETYKLHILTNGFRESQIKKLEACQLSQYFDSVLISGDLGFKKPQPEIFVKAMDTVGAVSESSLMVGDDLMVDVLGAASVGMDQVHYPSVKNVHYSDLKPTFTIHSLIELPRLLMQTTRG